MAAIKKLVLMDADSVGGTLDLDSALYQTAGAIRVLYGILATETMKQGYATAAVATYEFDGTGFQDAIYDLAEAIAMEAGASGGSSPATLDGRAVATGTFTLTTAAASHTVTHGLGEAPEIIAVISEGFDAQALSNAAPFMLVDTYRSYTSRFNTSGTLLISAGDRSLAAITATTFTAVGNGGNANYKLIDNVPYFWLALGAKPSGGGS